MSKEVHISLLDRNQDERIDQIIANGDFRLLGLDFGPLELINEANGDIKIRVKDDKETLCEFCQGQSVEGVQSVCPPEGCTRNDGDDDSC